MGGGEVPAEAALWQDVARAGEQRTASVTSVTPGKKGLKKASMATLAALRKLAAGWS